MFLKGEDRQVNVAWHYHGTFDSGHPEIRTTSPQRTQLEVQKLAPCRLMHIDTPKEDNLFTMRVPKSVLTAVYVQLYSIQICTAFIDQAAKNFCGIVKHEFY